MGKRIELTPNQKLFTSKGVETKWTYLNDVELRRYGKSVRRIVNVQCECGRTKEVQLNNVSGGHSVCCGYDPCKVPYNKDNRSIETTYNALYGAYKKGASDRGFSFELTKDEFKSFLDKDCYYCDSKPSNVYQIKNSKTGEVRAGVPITYNGIDRVDNNLGYTMDNSITCCETCNRMKRSHEYNFFLDHVKKICENMSKKLQV
jgi:hypothetical protein